MGACRNQLRENETFESLADLYEESLNKRAELEAEIARLKALTPVLIPAQVEEVDPGLPTLDALPRSYSATSANAYAEGYSVCRAEWRRRLLGES